MATMIGVVADDRDRLKQTFEVAASRYHRARPDYPQALYDDLIRLSGLQAEARLLEVGCGTGKATLPLAQRGFGITAVEVGPNLAAEARANLAGFRDVEIVEAVFETWAPLQRRYDLVYAATAWRWIDPEQRYRRAWELLRPEGHLAFWAATHVFPEGGDPFFAEIQEVYDEIGEGLPPGAAWPRPGELSDDRAEIEASGLFGDVVVHQYDWEVSYGTEGYLDLLDTFSGHIAMDSWKRDRLYGEIRRRLGRRPDGRVRRHWGAVLHVGRRVDQPAT